jgi:hypothetical protein
MRKALFGTFFLTVVSWAVPRPASAAIDAFNLLGVGFLETGVEYVYVRKSDGSIWHTGTPSTGWLSDGKPSTGATSGPQAARITNGGTQNLIFVEVGNTIYCSKGGQGAPWTVFTSGPPGGFTSGLAVSYDFEETSIHIAARGAGNIPYWIAVSAPPPPGGAWIISSWNQLGSSAISGAPGFAETDFRDDILALDGSDHLEMNTCEYPACYPGYTTVPGPVTGVSSPSALWWDLLGNYGGPFLAVAVGVSGGNAIVDTYTNSTNAFGGPVARGGSALGGGINGPVAVTVESPQNPTIARLAAHFADGNYYYNVGATSWFSLGHP